MSRLAKKPTLVPSGVTVTIDNNRITVKGPKGQIFKDYLASHINVVLEGNEITFSLKKTDVFARSLLGTYASHTRNMITGVTEGYTKKLILDGIGFKVNLSGNSLDMALGFSHPVVIEIPNNLQVSVEKNTIIISGYDKESVGQFAAKVRSQKKPEPYKGKGLRYDTETIRRKQGKKTG